MDFLKTITGKVVSGLVGVCVILLGISWWRMDDATTQRLLAGSGRIFAWLGIVLVLPWAAFLFIGWVNRQRSNLAGTLLVLGLTLAEALVLLKLFGWNVGGATAWTFFAFGTLFAGVYNLFICDWIAEKTE
jgi:hypothetical protein